jgi:hypothetical protein
MEYIITPEFIAKNCSYDGEKVFALLADALTDCNYHALRNTLESGFADYLHAEQIKYKKENA